MTFVGHFDEEHRLLQLSNLLVVSPQEILSNRNYFALVLEFHRDRVHVENNVRDEISSLVAPVSDDALLAKLKLCHLLKAVLIALHLVPNLDKSGEAGLSRLELEN